MHFRRLLNNTTPPMVSTSFRFHNGYLANMPFDSAPVRHPLQLSPINAADPQADQFFPNSATVQLNAVFGRELKSPRQPYPQHHGPKGPVPRFSRTQSAQEIQPRIHTQPAFRRANPEGGFISVSINADLCLLFTETSEASASPDDPPSRYLPYLQSNLQIRIF